MYTQYKREDLEELIQGNHELYNIFSLVADKLRVIWTALGWTHMTKEFSEADDTVEMLTQHVLEGLLSEKEESQCATAGLIVNGYWDDENLMLDYSFSL